MLLQAVLVPDDEDDRRSAERTSVNRPSTLRDATQAACDVYVRDISGTGFNVATDAQLTIGSDVTIGLPGHGRATARVVRRVAGGYGCEFARPLASTSVAQTFRGDTVIRLTSSAPIVHPFPEPVIARWPGVARVGVVIGGSAALWGMILVAASRLI